MSFKLPELPYDSDALEPHIDARTMEIHHSKHHQAYVTNLNNAVAGHAGLQDEERRRTGRRPRRRARGHPQAVRNNGGGHAQPHLFWKMIGPNGGGALGRPRPTRSTAPSGRSTNSRRPSRKAAMTRFGTGWAWLCVKPDGKLAV